MEKRGIGMILSYDGRFFSGWQRQENAPTVQGCLESVLSRMHGGQPCLVKGASRTDAGVHADFQLASFETEREYSLERWRLALNAQTPESIYVRELFELPLGFEPRLASRGKHYRYLLWQGQFLPPPLLGRAMCVRPLDLEGMRQAAAYLLGEHDFSAFRASDCQAKTSIRRLDAIEIAPYRSPFSQSLGEEAGACISIDVKGSAFLKQMVRIIVGTLLDFGLGRAPVEMLDILASRERRYAGQTAEAAGLTLIEAYFERPALGSS